MMTFDSKRRGQDTGRLSVMAGLEEAHRMLSAHRAFSTAPMAAVAASISLREGGAGEVVPEPAALVGFLCVLGRDPFGRVAPTCFCTPTEQRAFLPCLYFFSV